MRIIPNTWQPQARSKEIPSRSTHTPRIKEMTAFLDPNLRNNKYQSKYTHMFYFPQRLTDLPEGII